MIPSAQQREAMVRSCLPLVVSIASRYRKMVPSPYEFADLVSEGQVGLLAALEHYDPAHVSRAKFSTYARWKILSAVQEFLRCQTPLSRDRWNWRKEAEALRDRMAQDMGYEPSSAQVAEAMGMDPDTYAAKLQASEYPLGGSLDEPLTSHRDGPRLMEAIEDTAAETEDRRCLMMDLRRVLARLPERERHVILRVAEGWSLMEIGLGMGITESRVSQLHKQAVHRIHRWLGIEEV